MLLSMEKLSTDTEIVGYPVLPLVKQLVAKTNPDVAKYIHWGATTQDIMDNASILQIKEGLQLIDSHLQELMSILRILSKEHRDTPMAGRTHFQHALPCTFGFKSAVYLSSIVRHYERLEEIKKRCLLVQLGGAAGTLASLGSDDTGLQVRAALAQDLHLRDPCITWHAARDTIAEVLNYLGLLGDPWARLLMT